MVQTDKFSVFAPAKVNLHLAVKNKREDGFHDLESLFLALNFGDLLHFELVDSDSIEIYMENPKLGTGSQPVPMLENIIYKAITLFREKTGFSRGLKVIVEKRIPLGGGLGGGSSNAAAALLAMNKIMGFNGEALSLEALMEMGTALGSDVPFFLHQTPAAWVSGRGEIIEPVDIPPMFLVLVNPGFQSDTARAFRLLDEDLTRRHGGIGLNMNEFFNDFLDVFPEREKAIYNEIIAALQNQGAKYANLSGSGATCFGVFNDEDHAQKAVKALRGKWSFAECCRSCC